VSATVVARPDGRVPPRVDTARGTLGMWLFIVSEATLFVMLFFAYVYLGHGAVRWADPRPSVPPALAMLVVLLGSSAVLLWGERRQREGRRTHARAAVLVTAACGLAFLALQGVEYAKRLREITPRTNAYGSTFYAITGLHGLHVLLGVLMLLYVWLLPDMGEAERPPHRALHNAALYWHFVDAVWIVIVAALYLAPAMT
jgi:heme/copper-type cytochrome/quinol oxidase subunit 3